MDPNTVSQIAILSGAGAAAAEAFSESLQKIGANAKLQEAMNEANEAFAKFHSGIKLADFLSHEELLDLARQPNDGKVGFTLVNGNTWLPTPLYKSRKRQQHRAVCKSPQGVWTR